LPASPGAATGHAVFAPIPRPNAAARVTKYSRRQETNPYDIHGMDAAQGILTARGV